jgi:hypothetical protein
MLIEAHTYGYFVQSENVIHTQIPSVLHFTN